MATWEIRQASYQPPMPLCQTARSSSQTTCQELAEFVAIRHVRLVEEIKFLLNSFNIFSPSEPPPGLHAWLNNIVGEPQTKASQKKGFNPSDFRQVSRWMWSSRTYQPIKKKTPISGDKAASSKLVEFDQDTLDDANWSFQGLIESPELITSLLAADTELSFHEQKWNILQHAEKLSLVGPVQIMSTSLKRSSQGLDSNTMGQENMKRSRQEFKSGTLDLENIGRSPQESSAKQAKQSFRGIELDAIAHETKIWLKIYLVSPQELQLSFDMVFEALKTGTPDPDCFYDLHVVQQLKRLIDAVKSAEFQGVSLVLYIPNIEQGVYDDLDMLLSHLVGGGNVNVQVWCKNMFPPPGPASKWCQRLLPVHIPEDWLESLLPQGDSNDEENTVLSGLIDPSELRRQLGHDA